MDQHKSSPSQITIAHDLMWVVNSPSLITHASAVTDWPDKLGESDFDPEHLWNFLSTRRNHRVGFYFEYLIEYWLTHLVPGELIAKRLQIREEKRTLGELDFLFRDEQGQVHHLEAAVKFYLYHPHKTVRESPWIGPNARDTFERKMTRLFEHQLPMSEQIDTPVDVRHAFVKGRMFYHPSLKRPPSLPELLNDAHLQGFWIHVDDIELIAQSELRFLVLEKPYWLSHIRCAEDSSTLLLSSTELHSFVNTHFANSQHPLHLAVLQRQRQQWTETTRGFIVFDQWPDNS